MGRIGDVEAACKKLIQNGHQTVKSRVVADVAGEEDASWVGQLLFWEISDDPERRAFDEVRVKKIGESNGSNDYRIWLENDD